MLFPKNIHKLIVINLE